MPLIIEEGHVHKQQPKKEWYWRLNGMNYYTNILPKVETWPMIVA